MSVSQRGEGGAAPAATARFAQCAKAVLASAAIGLALAGPIISCPESVGASDKRAVGEISASGLVFKVSDYYNSPTIAGVLYFCFFGRMSFCVQHL